MLNFASYLTSNASAIKHVVGDHIQIFLLMLKSGSHFPKRLFLFTLIEAIEAR